MQINSITNSQNFGKWRAGNDITLSRGVAHEVLNGNYQRAAKSLKLIDELAHVDNYTFDFDMTPYAANKEIVATDANGKEVLRVTAKNIYKLLKIVKKSLGKKMQTEVPSTIPTKYYLSHLKTLKTTANRIKNEEYPTAPDKINEMAEYIENLVSADPFILGD